MLAGLPYHQVPVFINSFNRLGCLRRLIGWLQRAGYGNLHVIDNVSTYPPLLEYLTGLEQNREAVILRMEENYGPHVLWQQKLLKRLGIETEYVYTDPDVVPTDACPHDLVGVLQSVLRDYPNVGTAGVGLRLDDLPDTYKHKAVAISWERQFLLKPAGPGLFYAPIDTTFALYRPGDRPSHGSSAIRTDRPYLAAHEGWYLNHAAPSEEDLFYNRTAKPSLLNWSSIKLTAKMQRFATRKRIRV
jgi:hypothetical protein